jgi:hypothetical protein
LFCFNLQLELSNRPIEIDLWIPSYRIGVEYQGPFGYFRIQFLLCSLVWFIGLFVGYCLCLFVCLLVGWLAGSFVYLLVCLFVLMR